MKAGSFGRGLLPENELTADTWRLSRFIDAQAPVFAAVCAELAAGRKVSHWMWFIFPQLKVLGHSPTAKHFGLDGAAEASAYIVHPQLGRRLEYCAGLLLDHGHRTAFEIFGTPDDLKLRSSMTLFAEVAPQVGVFDDVLKAFFEGKPDTRTLAALHRD